MVIENQSMILTKQMHSSSIKMGEKKDDIQLRDGKSKFDAQESWIPLKDAKEVYPLELAEYIQSRDLQSEPAFAWCVPHVLKKKRNISLVKRLISDCEKNILQLEKDKSRIEKKMNDPNFYSGDNINIAKKAAKRHAELITLIANEEKTWSSLLIELEEH